MPDDPAEAKAIRNPFGLAAPVAIGNIFMLCPAVCDVWVAGRLGTTAQAAAGLGATLTSIVMVLVSGGLRSLPPGVSRTAAVRPKDTGEYFSHGLVLTLTASVATILIAGAVLLLTPLGHAEHGTFGHDVIAYLLIRVVGLPAFCLFICGNKFFIGIQKTGSIAIIAPIASALDVLLSVAFGLGGFGFPKLGVMGIALAYVVAWVVGAAIQLAYYRFGPHRAAYAAKLWPSSVDRAVLRTLTLSSAPLAGAALLGGSSYALAPALLAMVDVKALAAFTVVEQIYRVPQRLLEIQGSASGSLVASLSGRGREDLAHAQHRRSLWTTAVAFCAAAGVLVLFRDELTDWLAGDPISRGLAAQALVPAAITLAASVVATMSMSSLIAWNDVRFVSLFEIASGWVIFLPLCFVLLFAAHDGASGVWVAEAVEMIFTGAVLAYRVHSRTRSAAITPVT